MERAIASVGTRAQHRRAPTEQPPEKKMTYEEFLAWADEDTYAEWVDGEILMVSPASRRHQKIVGFLTTVLSAFVERHNLGEVIAAPFQMKLQHSGREPDVLFVAREHLDRLQEAYLEGPADLVVEVVSPESASRDRGEKFYEYEAAGIAEYWLIDPIREVGEFYRLEKGHYQPILVGREGVFHSSVVLGFWLKVEWLWQDPLPRLIDILREVGLV